MSIRILPSIASADMLDLRGAIAKTEEHLHIDIEDGNFVPNITFGMKTVSAICSAAGGKEIDVHLLVTNPMDYLNELSCLGAAAVCAHIEALPYPLLFLHKAKSLGMKAGLAFNITTPLTHICDIIEEIDYVLLMTAEPDDEGYALYPPALKRAVDFSKEGLVPVIADGGLDMNAVHMIEKGGAYAAVLGRNYFRIGE